VLRFLDALGRNAQVMVDARLQDQPGLRRVWYVLDLTLATLRGGVRFSLMTDPRGFDAVDDYDCREWLTPERRVRGRARVRVPARAL
jgi:hypothetical protein